MQRAARWMEGRKWLVWLILVITLLRIPSLFEPNWYGDEGIYLTIGQAIRQGVPLYSGIHDNKPPFLYWIAAAANGNQFWMRYILLWWNLATIILFVLLAGRIWGTKHKAVIISSWVFGGLITFRWLEGNIANAENFFLLTTIGAAYVLWKKEITNREIAIGGLLLGLGTLFKMPVILEAGIWPIVWLAEGQEEWFKKCLILGGWTLLPIGLSIGWFWGAGAGQEYLTAAWAQNLPYLSSWKTSSDSGGIFSLKGRAIIMLMALGLIAINFRKMGRNTGIILIWGVITIFAALLSGRPYPHYLLQSAGPLAMGAGLLAGGLWPMAAGVMLWTTLITIFVGFKFYYYPTGGYYLNFINWLANKKTVTEYRNWFDWSVNRDYEIAEWMDKRTTPQEKIFIWGDRPMIYALARRMAPGKYIARYHIKDFKAEEITIKILNDQRPTYIVVFGQADLTGLPILLENKYIEEKAIGEAKLYRLKI